VTVKTLSTPPTGASASVNPICLTGSTTLSVVGGTLGNGASWKWYSGSCGGTSEGVGATITVSPTATTTYYVRAEGDCNNTACASVTVTVNFPPMITSVSGPVGPIAKGTSTGVTVNFTGPLGLAHSVGISWDDTTTSNISLAAGVFTTGLVSHTYNTAGVYTVAVTVSNVCGSSATYTFQYIVVYDPNGGFVTGGGWIISPLGAYVPDPSLTGRANFGFVSKYQRGASVPTGETEFQFQLANLNFHSTVYEWLVISGAKGQYKGSGTINGAGNYGFLLTATDGQVNGGGGVDKFRIKIWDKDNNGAIVYDNAPGSDDIDASAQTAISGGSITIHK
jgi:PKD repeat protein